MARLGEIFTWSAPEDGFLVNSFFLHTPDGVLLIDAQFLPEHARLLRGEIFSRTGDQVTVVVITHPHPEHYLGLEVFTGEAEIWASEETAEAIRHYSASQLDQWRPLYGDRLPSAVTLPTHIFRRSRLFNYETLDLRSLSIEFIQMGPGEAHDHVVAYLPEESALVAPGLVYNGVHLWLGNGRSLEWIELLEELRGFDFKRLHPGHGPVGGRELIDENLAYIAHFRKVVGEFASRGDELTDQIREQIKRRIIEAYPDYRLPIFIDFGIVAEYGEQLRAA